jgi:outer membrane usher protein FimD/PapC
MGLDIDLTKKSFLTFSASGSVRLYESDASSSSLSDQTRVEGSFGFSHKQSERLTWNMKYTVWQNDYKEFETTRSHSATLGLAKAFNHGWSFALNAGPSISETEELSVSYSVDVNMAKSFQRNRFSVGYAHRAGDSTGLGGSTDSHQVMMSFSQTLGRTTSINFQASAYRQKQNATDGVSGSLALSQQLGRYCVLSAGSSYMGYDKYASKRFYASFGIRKTPRISQITRN